MRANGQQGRNAALTSRDVRRRRRRRFGVTVGAGGSDRGVAMSLLDQVRKLEEEVVDRLKQLEPLIFEYGQLRKVAERIGVKYTPPAAEPAAEGEPATRQGTPRPGRARAAAKS